MLQAEEQRAALRAAKAQLEVLVRQRFAAVSAAGDHKAAVRFAKLCAPRVTVARGERERRKTGREALRERMALRARCGCALFVGVRASWVPARISRAAQVHSGSVGVKKRGLLSSHTCRGPKSASLFSLLSWRPWCSVRFQAVSEIPPQWTLNAPGLLAIFPQEPERALSQRHPGPARHSNRGVA